jgi:hypothetical protein
MVQTYAMPGVVGMPPPMMFPPGGPVPVMQLTPEQMQEAMMAFYRSSMPVTDETAASEPVGSVEAIAHNHRRGDRHPPKHAASTTLPTRSTPRIDLSPSAGKAGYAEVASVRFAATPGDVGQPGQPTGDEGPEFRPVAEGSSALLAELNATREAQALRIQTLERKLETSRNRLAVMESDLGASLQEQERLESELREARAGVLASTVDASGRGASLAVSDSVIEGLRRSPMFHGASSVALRRIAEQLRVAHVPAGERLHHGAFVAPTQNPHSLEQLLEPTNTPSDLPEAGKDTAGAMVLVLSGRARFRRHKGSSSVVHSKHLHSRPALGVLDVGDARCDVEGLPPMAGTIGPGAIVGSHMAFDCVPPPTDDPRDWVAETALRCAVIPRVLVQQWVLHSAWITGCWSLPPSADGLAAPTVAFAALHRLCRPAVDDETAVAERLERALKSARAHGGSHSVAPLDDGSDLAASDATARVAPVLMALEASRSDATLSAALTACVDAVRDFWRPRVVSFFEVVGHMDGPPSFVVEQRHRRSEGRATRQDVMVDVLRQCGESPGLLTRASTGRIHHDPTVRGAGPPFLIRRATGVRSTSLASSRLVSLAAGGDGSWASHPGQPASLPTSHGASLPGEATARHEDHHPILNAACGVSGLAALALQRGEPVVWSDAAHVADSTTITPGAAKAVETTTIEEERAARHSVVALPVLAPLKTSTLAGLAARTDSDVTRQRCVGVLVVVDKNDGGPSDAARWCAELVRRSVAELGDRSDEERLDVARARLESASGSTFQEEDVELLVAVARRMGVLVARAMDNAASFRSVDTTALGTWPAVRATLLSSSKVRDAAMRLEFSAVARDTAAASLPVQQTAILDRLHDLTDTLTRHGSEPSRTRMEGLAMSVNLAWLALDDDVSELPPLPALPSAAELRPADGSCPVPVHEVALPFLLRVESLQLDASLVARDAAGGPLSVLLRETRRRSPDSVELRVRAFVACGRDAVGADIVSAPACVTRSRSSATAVWGDGEWMAFPFRVSDAPSTASLVVCVEDVDERRCLAHGTVSLLREGAIDVDLFTGGFGRNGRSRAGSLRVEVDAGASMALCWRVLRGATRLGESAESLLMALEAGPPENDAASLAHRLDLVSLARLAWRDAASLTALRASLVAAATDAPLTDDQHSLIASLLGSVAPLGSLEDLHSALSHSLVRRSTPPSHLLESLAASLTSLKESALSAAGTLCDLHSSPDRPRLSRATLRLSPLYRGEQWFASLALALGCERTFTPHLLVGPKGSLLPQTITLSRSASNEVASLLAVRRDAAHSAQDLLARTLGSQCAVPHPGMLVPVPCGALVCLPSVLSAGASVGYSLDATSPPVGCLVAASTALSMASSRVPLDEDYAHSALCVSRATLVAAAGVARRRCSVAHRASLSEKLLLWGARHTLQEDPHSLPALLDACPPTLHPALLLAEKHRLQLRRHQAAVEAGHSLGQSLSSLRFPPAWQMAPDHLHSSLLQTVRRNGGLPVATALSLMADDGLLRRTEGMEVLLEHCVAQWAPRQVLDSLGVLVALAVRSMEQGGPSLAVARALVRWTVLHPHTIGRQCVAHGRSLLASPGARALLSVVADHLPSAVSAELCLSSSTLTQLASVLEAGRAERRASRSESISASLSQLALPFSVRVVFPSVPTITPSIHFRTLGLDDKDQYSDAVRERLLLGLHSLGLVAEPLESDAESLVAGEEKHPSVSLPSGGVCILAASLASRPRVVSSQHDHSAIRVLQRVSLIPDTDEPLDATDGVRLVCHVPRPLSVASGQVDVCWFQHSRLSALQTMDLHCALANSLQRIWREAGLEIGESCPVYPFAVASHSPPLGAMLVPLGATSLSEAIGVSDESQAWDDDAATILTSYDRPSTDKMALQRWLATTMLERLDQAAREAIERQTLPSRPVAADDSSDDDDDSDASDVDFGETVAALASKEAYREIMRNYASSLASVVMITYLLGLGERRASDLTVTPAGGLSLLTMAFASLGDHSGEGALRDQHSRALRALLLEEEEDLHSDEGEGRVARFASPELSRQLLAVLGLTSLSVSHPAIAQLVAACTDALLAARRREDELTNILLAQDLAPDDLHSRLFLGLSETEAAETFTRVVTTFLGIDTRPTSAQSASPVGATPPPPPLFIAPPTHWPTDIPASPMRVLPPSMTITPERPLNVRLAARSTLLSEEGGMTAGGTVPPIPRIR